MKLNEKLLPPNFLRNGFQTVIMKRKISADSAGEPIKDSSLDELNRLPSLRHPYVGDSLPG